MRDQVGHKSVTSRSQVFHKCWQSLRDFPTNSSSTKCAQLRIVINGEREYRRSALEPTLELLRREADEFAEHRSRRIIRDAGSIEVCRGEGATGRCVLVHARRDGCLDILDIVQEADVPQALERLRTLPLAGRAPYKIRLNHKWWTFEATYRWPLIGVCQPDRKTLLLLSSVGAGLMITGVLKDLDVEESRFHEDWRAPFDLDTDDEVERPEAETNTHAAKQGKLVDRVEGIKRSTTATHGARRQPRSPASLVEAEYARLGCASPFEAFSLYIDQLGRHATAPDPRGKVDALVLLAGVQTAAAQGCVRLYGREQAIREQLAVYGVHLPERSVAPALRRLCELGCVFVSQPPPVKGRRSEGNEPQHLDQTGHGARPHGRPGHPRHRPRSRRAAGA